MSIDNNPSPLYFKIKKDLLSKIRSQVWPAETQIPTEQDLMDKYQVGRETIRKSIEMLVREGYLYKKRGIGTYVKSNAPTLTLEPLISLSYLISSRGYHEKTYVLKKDTLIVDEALQKLIGIPAGEKVIYLKRKRTVDDFVLGIEDSYFVYSGDVDQYNFNDSITKYLFTQHNLQLFKINQIFTKRKPTAEECSQLNIPDNIDIIEMERWNYMDGYDSVYFYVKLVMITDIYNYSF